MFESFEDLTDMGEGLLDKTPLSNMFYNGGNARRKGNEGAEAGLEYWKGLQAPEYQDVDMQGPEKASDVKYDPITGNAYAGISVDPSYIAAQRAQLDALSDLARNGGMNAQDAANLNAIQTNANQQAKANRDAVLQQAAMRGQGNIGGNALVSQMIANQGAANQMNQGGLDVAGQAQARALQAMMGAGQLGGQMQNQAWNQQAQAAQAQNAINQFNASNALNTAVYNNKQQQDVNNARATAHNQGQYVNKVQNPSQRFANQAQIGQGISGSGANQGGYYNNQQQMLLPMQAQNWSNATKLMSQGFGGNTAAGGQGGQTMAGPDMSQMMGGAGMMAMMASHGGKIPGHASVHGDSLANDSVQVMTSPGEVVVPRSLVSHGTGDQIAHFVKHAPLATTPDHEREAMLAALKHLRSHGGMK